MGAGAIDPDYGPVWAPTVVVEGWAPYSSGCWAWVDPWGWTWIDDAPWGFAPFHYGRWAFRHNAWGWVPGAHIGHAVYAPALVTFVGGGGWHSSPAPGGSVGWFPLGPHEPYIPPYRTNRTRLHNVDVEHIAYVNRSVPGAVTVVPNETFVRGQPTAGAALLLPNDELNESSGARGCCAARPAERELPWQFRCLSWPDRPASRIGDVSASGGPIDSAAPGSSLCSPSTGPCSPSWPTA